MFFHKLPCGAFAGYPHLSLEPLKQQMATCQLLIS